MPLTPQQNQLYYLEQQDYDWVEAVEHFSGLATIFHRLRQGAQLQAVRQFSQGQVLDAGCGTGLILRHLPAGSVGLDLNLRHLNKAKQYAPKSYFVSGDVSHLPFADSTFHTLVSGDMLGCLLDPLPALAEFHRVLASSGRLILSISTQSPLWQLRFLSRGPREPIYQLFTRSQVHSLLTQSKFHLLKSSSYCLGMELLVVAEKQ